MGAWGNSKSSKLLKGGKRWNKTRTLIIKSLDSPPFFSCLLVFLHLILHMGKKKLKIISAQVELLKLYLYSWKFVSLTMKMRFYIKYACSFYKPKPYSQIESFTFLVNIFAFIRYYNLKNQFKIQNIYNPD